MTVTCTKTDNLVTKRMLNIYTKFMHAEPEFCSFKKQVFMFCRQNVTRYYDV